MMVNKGLIYNNVKLFLVILVISFLFAKLDGGRNFESLEHAIEAITFNIILSYLVILTFVTIEKYIQRPTESKVKKYFILSSLVSLLVAIIFTLVVIIDSPDGFGSLVVIIAPLYIIPIVFTYTFIRMLCWYKFNLTTDKIMHFKYYLLVLPVVFFGLAFGGLDIIQSTTLWKIVSTPINSLSDFIYNLTQCVFANYCKF